MTVNMLNCLFCNRFFGAIPANQSKNTNPEREQVNVKKVNIDAVKRHVRKMSIQKGGKYIELHIRTHEYIIWQGMHV